MSTNDAASPVTFASLGLDERICTALATLGYEEPTPIQRAAIPALLAGKDLLGQAATGTGKTAAFALPMLHQLAQATPPGKRMPRALVLVPTRELAMQVAEAVHKYSKLIGLRVTPVYGGQDIVRQLKVLASGVDVVVATPGRALDHIRRGSLPLAGVRHAVLDEADEMLDLGFADDLKAILAELPAAPARQTALFSATMPRTIADIAQAHLHQPTRIDLSRETMKGALPKVRQVAYLVHRANKVASLVRILDVERPTSALVFCRTRLDVDQLTETLNGRGHAADALHGGLSQEQRDRVMKRFRAGKSELLVATDVAARGLDVKGLSHVINFEIPSAPEDYVHRIGRTGRAGSEGTAITLIEPREHRLLRVFEQLTRQKVEVAQLPTVADLHARRMELLRASLREAVLAGGFDRFRGVVEGLAGEHDVMDVAAAALKLVQDARAGGDVEEEQEIVVPAPPRERFERPGFERPGVRGGAREDRAITHGERPDVAGEGAPGAGGKKRPHPIRAGKNANAPGRPARDQPWPVARLWIGAGRDAGIRPGDLVGAIANEAGLPSRAIGAVEIADRHSIVELPEDVIDEVARVLGKAWIKGKKVSVRRDRA
jgi:ATP-dependent RNA helicase DeaD